MREIAEMIHTGAMAFLYREYRILAVFVVVVSGLISFYLNAEKDMCFVGGAFLSVMAGYFGMQAATRANCRTIDS